jgi:hypothetical protein
MRDVLAAVGTPMKHAVLPYDSQQHAIRSDHVSVNTTPPWRDLSEEDKLRMLLNEAKRAHNQATVRVVEGQNAQATANREIRRLEGELLKVKGKGR